MKIDPYYWEPRPVMCAVMVVGLVLLMIGVSCTSQPRIYADDRSQQPTAVPTAKPRVHIVEITQLDFLNDAYYFKTSIGDECYLKISRGTGNVETMQCRFTER